MCDNNRYHPGWDIHTPGIILDVGSANGRRRYIVTWSLIGWTHIQRGIIMGVGSANGR